MKFCYIDESGTGDEPFAVMAGVVVDAQRMRPTKRDWAELLSELSGIVGKHVSEVHTRDFYAGNGPWRGMTAEQRVGTINAIVDWLVQRKHHVVWTCTDKQQFYTEFRADAKAADVSTLWRFLALHLVLAIQKFGQVEKKNKGNTVLVFDNEEREELRFRELLLNPPEWTNTYYGRTKKQEPLDQIIDVPYFGDSREVGLLQVADFVAYFLRRHVEIQSGRVPARYEGEGDQVAGWVERIRSRSIPPAMTYPKKGRCGCAELFWSYAPEALRG